MAEVVGAWDAGSSCIPLHSVLGSVRRHPSPREGHLMRRRFLLTLAAVVLTAATFASAASANHSWGGYHWARTSNPFTVKLASNLTGSWTSILNTSSSDWSQSTVLDTVVVAGQTNPKNCRPT